jgi:hypothetical protein
MILRCLKTAALHKRGYYDVPGRDMRQIDVTNDRQHVRVWQLCIPN